MENLEKEKQTVMQEVEDSKSKKPQKRGKIKNRIKIMAAICLIAILSLGGTLAYMTDYEAAENKFTVGKVDFNLYETSWDGELPDGSYATPSNASHSDALGINEATDMYAGKEIPKDPAIKNNSKNDAYLRMTVTIPVARVITADEDGNLNFGGQEADTELFTYEVNPDSGMRLLSSQPEEKDGYHIYEYIYTGGGWKEIPVPAGHDIPPLFDKVTFANVTGGQIDESTEFIHVDFKAIQSGGFDSPEQAWKAYHNQSGDN
ncbi:MAG: hypothetical protein HFG49_13465 [Lachnospiraceae bacterium]|jgi:predicted ribosomally synthesized peptide with SipW-like signal peptide|nr:hypothetical protein [Lachnospiraceae bacterium]